MSHISEIRVTLASDQRNLLKKAGKKEINFVHGVVAEALNDLAKKMKQEEERQERLAVRRAKEVAPKDKSDVAKVGKSQGK